jgi:fucose permease
MALSGVALLLMALFRIRGVSLIWCALFGLFAGPCWPTVFSIGLDLDLKASGKLTSIMMILNSLGLNLGNIAIGAAADTFGVQNAYYFSAAVAIPGILVFLLAVKYFRKAGKLPEGKAWEEWKTTRAAQNSLGNQAAV